MSEKRKDHKGRAAKTRKALKIKGKWEKSKYFSYATAISADHRFQSSF